MQCRVQSKARRGEARRGSRADFQIAEGLELASWTNKNHCTKGKKNRAGTGTGTNGRRRGVELQSHKPRLSQLKFDVSINALADCAIGRFGQPLRLDMRHFKRFQGVTKLTTVLLFHRLSPGFASLHILYHTSHITVP